MRLLKLAAFPVKMKINDVLDFNMISQTKFVPKMTIFDLKCAAKEVVKALLIKNDKTCEIVLKGSSI